MALTACFQLFQRRRVHVETDGLGGLGRRRLRARFSLVLADERDAAIFGVDGAVVSKEEIAADEGAAALEAFEGTFFGIWSDKSTMCHVILKMAFQAMSFRLETKCN